MKHAAAYIRISDKDQSNFSLEGQERYIREYANKNNIEITALFIDDGKSAKNFDRPNWKLLEDFVVKQHKNVDFLLVVKYDRFSRNAAEGLQKIELLERKYHIIIVSVFEQMFIDYDSPFFFKQRADILVNAEFELHVIRDRTKFGIHQALLSGRYVSKAPFGYKNARDKSNKPIIVIDESKAFIVRQIFEDYLHRLPIKEVYKNATKRGLTNRGHSCIPNILSNPVYGGLLNVPAYRKEPAKLVQGIHEAIVSEVQWRECDRRLNNIRYRTTLNEAVPLRGVLLDANGNVVTAGESKGKTQKYWYYKSTHTAMNVSAKKLHQQFDEVLKHMSLPNDHIDYLKSEAKKELDHSLSNRNKQLEKQKEQLVITEKKRHRLEEKFLCEEINAETYSKWSKIYATDFAALEHSIASLNMDANRDYNCFEVNIHKLADLHFIYHQFDVQQKQLFVKQVFNSALWYDDGVYRTPFLMKPLRHNELILKEKRLLFLEQPSFKIPEILRCTPDGS